jgi:hypothetical protein
VFSFLEEVKTYRIKQDFTTLHNGDYIMSVHPSIVEKAAVIVEFHLTTTSRPKTSSLKLNKGDCLELSRHFADLASAL